MSPKKKAEGARSAGIDLQQVEHVIEFMAKHGLEEFEYANGGLRIRLKKAASNSNAVGLRLTAPEIVLAGAPAVPQPEISAESREASAEPARTEETHVVKSPIVGTFYEGPSPGAEPFVKVGDHVEPGQILCIIEAMKLMNEIESDVTGEVMRIFVENGQPVEYGETLFAIRPSRKK
jgi:acetyl-CoA carboxylase biotin carboxyl carrier protein